MVCFPLSAHYSQYIFKGCGPYFSHFNFAILYVAGNKNTKADALSRLYNHEPIIPSELNVSSIDPIEGETPPTSLEGSHTIPLGCPPGLQYIPRTQCTPLILSAHSSLGRHWPPRGQQNPLVAKRQLLVARNGKGHEKVYAGVQGMHHGKDSMSSTCLKVSTPACPYCPWLHLGVDFMNDLPVSGGNTCIMVILDRFSKFCKLIPLQQSDNE